MIYMVMAIYVQIQGNYEFPHVFHRNERLLREAIEEARKHFTYIHPMSLAPRMDTALKTQYAMQDLGDLQHYLGITKERSEGQI